MRQAITVQSPTVRPALLRPWTAPTLTIAVAAAAVMLLQPDPAPLLAASPVIKVHLGAAVLAFFLGVVMLASRKGATFHRRAGWLWAGLITLVAGSSLFITTITPGRWSYIHILTGLTLVMLPMALIAARRHNVKAHRKHMLGLFFGGMIIAGAFTFVPGRLMWQVFFG